MESLEPLTDDHEALLSAVVGAMPEPFFVIDRAGRYVAVLGATDSTDYHDGRGLVGRRMHDVMPAALADTFLEKVHEALDTGRVVTYEYELSSVDIEGVESRPGLPDRLWFQARIAPLPSHRERVDMVVWMIFGITELKQALHRLEAQQLELTRLASTDPLTGLLNRRSFFEAARAELAFTRRTGDRAALVLLDLDLFKTVNDTWGHGAGDAVLVAVAATLVRGRRASDVVARIGGEEMAIVLRSTSIDRATDVAERLRVELGSLAVPHGDDVIRTTASFGVTSIEPTDRDVEDALRRADLALYTAKHDGRNRVATSPARRAVD